MMKLTSDNVFWFIYQYNCAVGHPTIIPKRAFEKEFSMPWIAIAPLVNQLEKSDGLIIRRYAFVYYLTEKGLTKATAMSQYMQEDVMVTKRFWLEIGQYLVAFYDKMHGIKCLLSFLISAAILPSNATTWYVTKNGSDSNTGKSESTAFLTIQKAVDGSATGDQIIVNDGVYDSISTGNRDITIKSKNGAGKTIIDGKDSSTPFNVGGNYDQIKSVLIGFTLRNGRSPGNYNMGGAARGGTLKNCILTNNFASSNAGGAHFSHMENCLIIACNSCYGYASAAYSCELRNCTVTQNRLDGSLAGGKCALYQCTVYNSIVYDNPCGGIGTGCSAYNCVTTDPLFRDAAHGDYRLLKTSSCIDTGNNSYSTTDTDLAGKARIYNGTVDIGAYEYQPDVQGSVSNIVAQQRYPWNGMVDVAFTITGDAGTAYQTTFAAKDVAGGTNLVMKTVWEDGKSAASSRPPQLTPGNYRFVWNAGADLPDGTKLERVAITVEAK